MKIAIIGAGNMGGSIAQGLSIGKLISTSDIIVADLDKAKLEILKYKFPELKTTNNKGEAAHNANSII